MPRLRPHSRRSGWISLFNGKDFTGWKVGGDQSTFQIKDGALVAHGPVAHAFYEGPVNNHDFKNFELMVDVMAAPNSNGGVYFHTEFQESGFPRKGFEVQVNNTFLKDPIKSGSLYHVKDIGVDEIKGITKDNEWFTEHIIVQDKTVTIRLNGKEVVKWTQPADWNGGREGAGTRARPRHDRVAGSRSEQHRLLQEHPHQAASHNTQASGRRPQASKMRGVQPIVPGVRANA